MVMAEIKAGYKKTDIGVIPEDWDAPSMGELAQIQRGASPRPINSPVWFDNKSTVGWLRISDVSKSRKYLRETTQCLSDAGIANSRYIARNNLIMSICATVGRPIITCKDLCIHDGFVVFDHLKADKEYMYYALSNIENDWTKYGQTGSQMNLNTGLINNTRIPLPKPSEQKAIAAALSDVDEMIEVLSQLITKKRDMKTAAMQQLLTGKKRLPGFDGEWDAKKLEDVVEIKKGQLITEKTAVKGEIPVIAGGLKPSYYHNQSNRKPNVVTISASGASAGFVGFHPYAIFASDCSTIEKSNTYDVKFIFFVLQLRQSEIYKLQTGGAQPHVYPEHIKGLHLLLPAIKEQSAIATILSDMDTEIDALEQRLEKSCSLKTGMMQELLTGKTRLIKTNQKQEEV
jgi:type I restriction enzyme, S subunit